MRPAARKWMLLLGGLVVWAVHFFLLYAFASIFPGSQTARWLAAAATVLGVAANGLIFRAAVTSRKQAVADDLDDWVRQVARLGCLLSVTAILWQGLVALF